MKYFHTSFFLLLSMLCSSMLFSQISFTNQTNVLNNPNGFTSGNVLGVADMNADGYDDIIRMNNSNMLSIEYQNPDSFSYTNYTHGQVSGNAWAIVVGDVNNDGYCDIMAGGAYDNVKVLIAMDNGTSYLSSILPGPGLFVQGSNMADINNDGFLDIFACHDDAESRIWSNNGSGIFSQADQWIDMITTPASDNSGNYGSVWTDFDNDGDQDLYIAKCRIGVQSPSDPRRINALFVNDGNNNFHEDAGEYGLKIGAQSWTSDFQDIDNDGDLDCFITNHDTDLQLLENDGTGHFTDISVAAGVSTGSGFNFVQGIMKDFDNDGFVDIITAQPTLFFRNNGDKTFTETDPFGESFGSLAVGDLNHDGFVDVYTAYQSNFNSPSSTPDKLWINDANSDNHYLNVSLTGIESNKMGVGARIEIFGDWGIQVREVRAGESYGISNSLSQNFGVAGDTIIPYVVVKWPSGIVDILTDVDADQFITIEEGSSCDLADFQIATSNEIVLCLGESTTLTAPDGYTYLWNNGSTAQSITTDSPGTYNVVIVDDEGCVANSNTVKVVFEPDETPTISLSGDTQFCEGGSVEISSSPSNTYQWSNGETTQSIMVTTSGTYSLMVEGVCSDFFSDTVEVEVLDRADLPTADDVTIVAPATATLEATGENPHWYETPDATMVLGEGNTFETPELTETTTYYVAAAKEYGDGNFSTGITDYNATYNGQSSNGQLLFEVFETIVLNQVTVGTDSPGIRVIELRNNSNDVLQLMTTDLPEGVSVVDLNFTIEPGIYRLTTNTGQNQALLGTNSPRLYRNDEGVQYPYEVPGVLSINGSNFGSGFYYYFYDWQIETAPYKCFSDRVPVVVNVEPNAVREIVPFGQIAVMPNPSNGRFTLEVTAFASGEAEVMISDITGKQVYGNQFEARQNVTEYLEFELNDIAAGMYFLKIQNGERASWLKLVIE